MYTVRYHSSRIGSIGQITVFATVVRETAASVWLAFRNTTDGITRVFRFVRATRREYGTAGFDMGGWEYDTVDGYLYPAPNRGYVATLKLYGRGGAITLDQTVKAHNEAQARDLAAQDALADHPDYTSAWVLTIVCLDGVAIQPRLDGWSSSELETWTTLALEIDDTATGRRLARIIDGTSTDGDREAMRLWIRDMSYQTIPKLCGDWSTDELVSWRLEAISLGDRRVEMHLGNILEHKGDFLDNEVAGVFIDQNRVTPLQFACAMAEPWTRQELWAWGDLAHSYELKSVTGAFELISLGLATPQERHIAQGFIAAHRMRNLDLPCTEVPLCDLATVQNADVTRWAYVAELSRYLHGTDLAPAGLYERQYIGEAGGMTLMITRTWSGWYGQPEPGIIIPLGQDIDQSGATLVHKFGNLD